jgi:hypothetical protein
VEAVDRTLGIKPKEAGRMLVFDLPAAELARYKDAKPLDLQRRFAAARFETLLLAANQNCESGRPLDELTPLQAQKMGLLPANWVEGRKVPSDNGLWLGTIKGAIGVGITVPFDAVKPLIERYGADAASIYFPAPHPLKDGRAGGTFKEDIVIVFDRVGLNRAAARVERPPQMAEHQASR